MLRPPSHSRCPRCPRPAQLATDSAWQPSVALTVDGIAGARVPIVAASGALAMRSVQVDLPAR